MSAKEKLYPLGFAHAAAEELADILRPTCDKIEIAGSVRRGCPTVHDIDLVVAPKWERREERNLFGELLSVEYKPAELHRLLALLPGGIARELDVNSRIIRFTGIECIPVELYLAEPPDGANFYALLQMRTGSADFNRHLALRANDRRLYYKAGHGLYRPGEGGARVDDGTEEGIFAALGMAYVPPEKRSWK